MSYFSDDYNGRIPLIANGVILPYILDLFPHLTCGDLSPMEALQLVLNRWGNLRKPHIVADVGFGSLAKLSNGEVQQLSHVLLTPLLGFGNYYHIICLYHNSALQYKLPLVMWLLYMLYITIPVVLLINKSYLLDGMQSQKRAIY